MKKKERKITEKLKRGFKIQNTLKKAKEDWIDTQCKETDAFLNKNNSKMHIR